LLTHTALSDAPPVVVRNIAKGLLLSPAAVKLRVSLRVSVPALPMSVLLIICGSTIKCGPSANAALMKHEATNNAIVILIMTIIADIVTPTLFSLPHLVLRSPIYYLP
jgi:hypothetical protein